MAVLVVGLAAARTDGVATPAERAESLERRLACPICDGESVYESRNRASTNIRNRITTLVDEGRLSDDEIIADLRRTYDEKILLVPQASGTDALGVGPAGGGVRRRGRRPDDRVPALAGGVGARRGAQRGRSPAGGRGARALRW